jgi:hypothetical protein
MLPAAHATMFAAHATMFVFSNRCTRSELLYWEKAPLVYTVSNSTCDEV